ncbi:MAG TPA: hypothetical protein VMV46_20360 [Thermoanaerobaculia bacterium]|nr:hypothetical protein [Thermoanaerobaculia bacterium]
MSSEPNDLVAQVLAGHDPRLTMLAADGLLPLPPEHLIGLQVHLATAAGPDVAARARAALEAYEVQFLVDFVEATATVEAVSHLALTSPHPAVVEAAIRRRDLPAAALAEIAAGASEEIQEIVLLRQDLIVREPRILDSLEANPGLSRFARRLIAEVRRDVLGQYEPTPEAAPEEEGAAELEAEEAEVAAAIEAARELPAEGEVDEQTGLSEGQIRALPVAVRLTLARGATRTLRGILIRDANPQVAVAVLKFSAITESEVELVAKNRAVVEDVLMALASNREWMRKYRVLHNLVRNPRCPPGVAVRFLPRLSIRDLSQVRFDRGVSDAVRQTARRMFETKTK